MERWFSVSRVISVSVVMLSFFCHARELFFLSDCHKNSNKGRSKNSFSSLFFLLFHNMNSTDSFSCTS